MLTGRLMNRTGLLAGRGLTTPSGLNAFPIAIQCNRWLGRRLPALQYPGSPLLTPARSGSPRFVLPPLNQVRGRLAGSRRKRPRPGAGE